MYNPQEVAAVARTVAEVLGVPEAQRTGDAVTVLSAVLRELDAETCSDPAGVFGALATLAVPLRARRDREALTGVLSEPKPEAPKAVSMSGGAAGYTVEVVGGSDLWANGSRKSYLSLHRAGAPSEVWSPGDPLPTLWAARLDSVNDAEAYRASLYLLGSRWAPSRSNRSEFKVSLARQVLDWLNGEVGAQWASPLSRKQVRAARRMEYQEAQGRRERIERSTGGYDGRDYAAAAG